MIRTRLEELRTGYSGCLAVALADLPSKTVLCTSSEPRQSQERFDALRRAATTLFSEQTRVANTANSDDIEAAVVLGTTQQCVFLKAAGDTSEAILTICDLNTDTSDFIAYCKTKMEGGLLNE